MKPVWTAAQTRELDNTLIEALGFPSRALMEMAGHGAAVVIQQRFPEGRIGVLCGPGNNGGDGLVIARWLALWGREVAVWAMPPKTPDSSANHALCKQMGIDFRSLENILRGTDVAVDALFGTGQRLQSAGEVERAINTINTAPQVVCIDVPTGVCADTGQAGQPAVQATLTLTLGGLKPGLFCAPGRTLAGEVECIDIGLGLPHVAGVPHPTSNMHLLEAKDVEEWRRAPHRDDAKWDRGHVGVFGWGGAATLAAHGAFRGGAGLVTLFAPKDHWPSLHGLWPEVILATPDELNPARHDAIVIGPGLQANARSTVIDLWQHYPGPVVADAGALNIMANEPTPRPKGVPRVLTPHSAEAARLLGIARGEVEADRFEAGRRLSTLGTAVLKGPNSLICDEEVWVNPRGSQHLATAGTGDILAGMVAARLAGGLPPAPAAASAAWDHGAAGEDMSPGGTASDLLEILQSS